MKSSAVIMGAVFAILLAVSGLAEAALQNSSFEVPDDPENYQSDHANSWGRWGHWINRETGWSPTRSGDCLLGYHHFRIEEEDDSGIYQDVGDIAKDSHCIFKISVFKDEGTNVDDVEVRLEPWNGGDALASTHYNMGSLPSGRWKELQVSATNPSLGVRVVVVVTPNKDAPRDGALKFDNAELATN